MRGAIQLKPSSEDKSRQREGVEGSGGVTEKTGEGAVFKEHGVTEDVEEMEAPEDEKPTEVQKQKNDEKEKKEKKGDQKKELDGERTNSKSASTAKSEG